MSLDVKADFVRELSYECLNYSIGCESKIQPQKAFQHFVAFLEIDLLFRKAYIQEFEENSTTYINMFSPSVDWF